MQLPPTQRYRAFQSALQHKCAKISIFDCYEVSACGLAELISLFHKEHDTRLIRSNTKALAQTLF